MAQQTQLTIVRSGRWVKPRSMHRNPTYWHWVHRDDLTAYCGIRRPVMEPSDLVAVEEHFEPLMRCCQKCRDRIRREGY